MRYYNRFILTILFVLAFGKTEAKLSSTTNNIAIREHILKKRIKTYCINEDIPFDTIPQMHYDEYFFEAYDELVAMLIDRKTYNFKRAEFLVEWAYSGGTMNYSNFCHDIDSVASILKHFIEINNIQQYKTAPNYALFEYFTKPNPMNGYKSFSYDFNDFTGKNDFRNLFITKVIKTHTGQCVSLPTYYKILCDELGGQSSLYCTQTYVYKAHRRRWKMGKH